MNDDTADADLAQVERARLRALVDADISTADRLHADEFQLVTPGGGTYTKEGYLGGIAAGEIVYLRWDPFDISVRTVGDAGCVRYHAIVEIVFAGRPLGADRFWHTDYYERRDGHWQVVWSHATRITG